MTAGVALDTNVLLYPILERRSPKGETAAQIIKTCSRSAIVAAQTLLEYLAVVRRHRPDHLDRAIEETELWARIMTVAPTNAEVIAQASRLIRDHRFQVWDAVIWAASRAAGARFLLSEDMQDGLELGGLTVINPFDRDVAELLGLIGR